MVLNTNQPINQSINTNVDISLLGYNLKKILWKLLCFLLELKVCNQIKKIPILELDVLEKGFSGHIVYNAKPHTRRFLLGEFSVADTWPLKVFIC